MPAPQLSLKARALRFLSLREHSRLELARKLSKYAEEGDDVEALLDLLEKNNWLSQERFSESLIHRRATRYGNSRIVAELQSHGVNGEALQELKSNLADTEIERARDIWQRKFGGQQPADMRERAQQSRFLTYRGFALDQIGRLLRGADLD